MSPRDAATDATPVVRMVDITHTHMDVTSFLRWAIPNLGYPSLQSVLDAAPTAELEPTSAEYTQTDEVGACGRVHVTTMCESHDQHTLSSTDV